MHVGALIGAHHTCMLVPFPATNSWARFLPRTCQERAKNLPRTCQELAKNLPRSGQDLAQDAKIMPAKFSPRSCQELAQDLI